MTSWQEGQLFGLPKVLATIAPVLKRFQPQRRPVVYFLVRDNQLTYVGVTVSLETRIRTHRKTKVFDHIFYFEVGPTTMHFDLENQLIVALRPPENGLKTDRWAHWTITEILKNNGVALGDDPIEVTRG